MWVVPKRISICGPKQFLLLCECEDGSEHEVVLSYKQFVQLVVRYSYFFYKQYGTTSLSDQQRVEYLNQLFRLHPKRIVFDGERIYSHSFLKKADDAFCGKLRQSILHSANSYPLERIYICTFPARAMITIRTIVVNRKHKYFYLYSPQKGVFWNNVFKHTVTRGSLGKTIDEIRENIDDFLTRFDPRSEVDEEILRVVRRYTRIRAKTLRENIVWDFERFGSTILDLYEIIMKYTQLYPKLITRRTAEALRMLAGYVLYLSTAY